MTMEDSSFSCLTSDEEELKDSKSYLQKFDFDTLIDKMSDCDANAAKKEELINRQTTVKVYKTLKNHPLNTITHLNRQTTVKVYKTLKNHPLNTITMTMEDSSFSCLTSDEEELKDSKSYLQKFDFDTLINKMSDCDANAAKKEELINRSKNLHMKDM
ncbi:hypothetical protein ACFE04_009010 [Oxalis oulophora]